MVTGRSQSRTATQNLTLSLAGAFSQVSEMFAGFRCVALGSFRLCFPNYLGLCRGKANQERAAALPSACLRRLTSVHALEKALLYLQNDLCD